MERKFALLKRGIQSFVAYLICYDLWALRTVWPNLAKFCHLDKLSKIWGKLFGFILCLAKFWVFFVNFGQIRAVVTVSSQIMKNNLAIWSHCLLHSLTVCVASAASCSSQQRHTTELLSFTTFAAFWHFLLASPFVPPGSNDWTIDCLLFTFDSGAQSYKENVPSFVHL